MKAILQTFALLILFILPVQAEEKKAGIVSFTFDDGSRNQYTHAFPIMKEHGLTGTLYVVSGATDDASRNLQDHSVTWSQVREMQREGWEIGGHSHTHPYLTKTDPMSLFGETAFNKRRIFEEVGVVPVSFASPYGDFDPRVLIEVKRHYPAHLRAWGGDVDGNPLPLADRYEIARFDVRQDFTTHFVCDTIADAGSSGKWLVLMFHHVVDNDPVEYQISADFFADIVKCAAALEKDGRIQVRTVADVINEEGEVQ